MQHWLVSNFLCSQGWVWTSGPPNSASQWLQRQTCTPTAAQTSTGGSACTPTNHVQLASCILPLYQIASLSLVSVQIFLNRLHASWEFIGTVYFQVIFPCWHHFILTLIAKINHHGWFYNEQFISEQKHEPLLQWSDISLQDIQGALHACLEAGQVSWRYSYSLQG